MSTDSNLFGDLPIAASPQRVSGMKILEQLQLPTEPIYSDPASNDSWRQTGFNLGADLRLIQSGLDISLEAVNTGYQPQSRSMVMAGYASQWSRSLLSIADAVLLIRSGSYQSAMSIIRQSVESAAAFRGLKEEIEEWTRWTHEAFGTHTETKATEIGIGIYFAGSVIASEESIRNIYRAASDFGRPNFGPTSLFVANEATHEKYPLHFGDKSFHIGWSQLLLGWANMILNFLLQTALQNPNEFPIEDSTQSKINTFQEEVDQLLSDPNRCYLDEFTDPEGRKRHLLTNFRRQPSDATSRILF